MLGSVGRAGGPAGGHLACLGGGVGGGGLLVQQGVFHSPDILSHRLVVVEGEAELVQLAGAQLAQLQRVEGHCCVEAGLVHLVGRGQRRHLHSRQQDLQLRQL